MQTLVEFIRAHSIRGACVCGECCDSQTNTPKPIPSAEHTADLVFFPVTLNQDTPPSPEAFIKLIQANRHGINLDLDLFDGRLHDYFSVGAWRGDQALALRLMGMGALLNIWSLITPLTEFAELAHNKEAAINLASNGFLFIQTRRPLSANPERESETLII